MNNATAIRSPRYYQRAGFTALLALSLGHCNPAGTAASSGSANAAHAVAPAAAATTSPATSALLDQNLSSATAASASAAASGQCGTTVTSLSALPAPLASLNQNQFVQTPAGDTASRLAVFSALSAVPRSLLNVYFVAMGGQIIIGDAATLCKDTPLTSDERSLLGNPATIPACWRAAEGSDPARLILNPDQTLIRSSLVRLFAFWEVEFFLTRLQDPGVPAPFNSAAWHGFTTGLATERTRLADAFIADLANANAPSLASLTQHQNTDPTGFGNLVYANALDSYYCSQQARQSLQDNFKNTWSVFTDASVEQSPLNQLGLALTN